MIKSGDSVGLTPLCWCILFAVAKLQVPNKHTTIIITNKTIEGTSTIVYTKSLNLVCFVFDHRNLTYV